MRAGAIVKHYGNEKKFKDINVNLTQRIVDICKKYKKRFLHISSISVSGKRYSWKITQSKWLLLQKIIYTWDKI